MAERVSRDQETPGATRHAANPKNEKFPFDGPAALGPMAQRVSGTIDISGAEPRWGLGGEAPGKCSVFLVLQDAGDAF